MTTTERFILENQLVLLNTVKINLDDSEEVNTTIQKIENIIALPAEQKQELVANITAPVFNGQDSTNITYMEWLYDTFGLKYFSRDADYDADYDSDFGDEPLLVAYSSRPSKWRDGTYSYPDDGISSKLILDEGKIPMIPKGQCYNIVDKEFVTFTDLL